MKTPTTTTATASLPITTVRTITTTEHTVLPPVTSTLTLSTTVTEATTTTTTVTTSSRTTNTATVSVSTDFYAACATPYILGLYVQPAPKKIVGFSKWGGTEIDDNPVFDRGLSAYDCCARCFASGTCAFGGWFEIAVSCLTYKVRQAGLCPATNTLSGYFQLQDNGNNGGFRAFNGPCGRFDRVIES